MNGSSHGSRPFRVIVSPSGIRFLGLPLVERNFRVARRLGGIPGPDAPTHIVASLSVPAGAAITQALGQVLETAPPCARLHWAPNRKPLEWNAGPSDGAPIDISVPEGAVLDVATIGARHRSAWTLLRASGKPRDGWLSRHIHRRVSRVFSYVFLLLGLSPNMATGFAFMLGAVGAWFMAQTTHGTMIAGALLYWGASVADGIDGEMARLTMSESAFGEQLDTAVDQATHLLALAGAGVGWWRQGFGMAGFALATLVLIGAPTILLWAMSMVRKAHQTSQFFVVTKPIELAVVRAGQDSGSAVLRLAAAVFLLFRRESMAAAAFAVSLGTGLRVVYAAIVASALAMVAAIFLMYKPDLDRALRVNVRP
ncbi:MAG: CDP-alcohol phosphatidyltransferase family protein [Vicinamibacterales bacterium]